MTDASISACQAPGFKGIEVPRQTIWELETCLLSPSVRIPICTNKLPLFSGDTCREITIIENRHLIEKYNSKFQQTEVSWKSLRFCNFLKQIIEKFCWQPTFEARFAYKWLWFIALNSGSSSAPHTFCKTWVVSFLILQLVFELKKKLS